MKRCLINNLYEPYAKGGAETVVKTTALGLLKRGYDVCLVTVGRKDKVIWMDGIKVRYIKIRNIFSVIDIDQKNVFLRLVWWKLNFLNFWDAWKILQIIKQEQAEIVHAHNLVGLSFLLPMFLKMCGKKYIQTVHDIQLAYPSGQLLKGEENKFVNNFFLRKWYEKIVRLYFGSPNIIISPSSWLLNFYQQKGFFKKSKKIIVFNPVHISQNNLARIKDNNQKDEALKLLFVGRVEMYKGIVFLIEVLNSLDNKKYQLQVVGGGREIFKAQKLAEGNRQIVFCGELSRDEVIKKYLVSDLLIVPTLTYENLPTVILEALSCSLPVVAANIGGIPEIVTKKNGWLFEPGNKEELEKILINIFNHKEKAQEMRESCLVIADRFDEEKYLNEIDELYRN